MRRIAACINCGEVREIVAHGLCSKCLMRNRRAEDKRNEPAWLAGPDRSQNRSQRELNKLHVNFTKMKALLEDTPSSQMVIPDAEYRFVKGYLLAWIDRISEMQKLTVNSEPELTVNSRNDHEKVLPFTPGEQEEESRDDSDEGPA